MLKKIFPVVLPSVFLLFVLGCSAGSQDEACNSRPVTTPVKIEIEQFEDTLAAIRTKAEFVSFMSRQPLIRDYMLRRQEYPGDSTFINLMYSRFSSPGFDTLLAATKEIHGDLSKLKTEFEEAFSSVKYYYPDYTPPKIKTIISGMLDFDMFVTDTVVVISLDYFLGKNGKFRPRVYDYQLRKFDPDDIVPSVMLVLGIDTRYNATDLSDKTMLADMIAYGKSFYFAKQMMPCVPDSTFIWYSQPEMDGSKKNQDLIWARLVQDKIIFSTSNEDRRNYLYERPATTQVGDKCPGRIGQFVGWQIVKSFMKNHPETTLPELMKMKDAQKLFKESKYNPKHSD